MPKKEKYQVYLQDVNAIESFAELTDALEFVREYVAACDSAKDDQGTCNPGLIRIQRQ